MNRRNGPRPKSGQGSAIHPPMFDLRKLFAKDAMPGGRTAAEAAQSPGPGEGLEVEYERLIRAQFERLGISSECATVEVRRIGQGSHGFDVLVAMVRLHRWERASALKLLVGLPLIESRLRKLVRSTWLADYSHFAGLWLHASEHLHEDPGVEELRELLTSLAPPTDPLPARTTPTATRRTPPDAASAREKAVSPHSAPFSG